MSKYLTKLIEHAVSVVKFADAEYLENGEHIRTMAQKVRAAEEHSADLRCTIKELEKKNNSLMNIRCDRIREIDARDEAIGALSERMMKSVQLALGHPKPSVAVLRAVLIRVEEMILPFFESWTMTGVDRYYAEYLKAMNDADPPIPSASAPDHTGD